MRGIDLNVLIRNLLSSWASRAIVSAGALISTGIGARYLGLELLGLWAIISSVALYLQYLDLGMAAAMHRGLPRLIEQQNWRRVRETVWAGIAALLALGTVVTIFAVWIGGAFGNLFAVPEGFETTAQWAMILAIVLTAIGLPFRVGVGLLGAAHKFYVVSFLEIAGVVAKVSVLAILAYASSLNFEAYVSTILWVGLAVLLAQTAFGFKAHSFARLRPARPSRSALKALGHVSGASLAITFGNLLITQGAVPFVGYLQGPEGAAMYAYPALLVTTLIGFAAALAPMFAPIASQVSAKGQDSDLDRLFRGGSEFVAVFACGIAAFLWLFGEELLEVWLAARDQSASALSEMYAVVTIMSIGGVASAIGVLSRNTMIGLGHYWVVATTEVGVILIGFVLGIFVLAWTGSLAAYSTAIAVMMVIKGALAVPIMTCYKLHVGLGTFFWAVLFRPAASALAAVWSGRGVMDLLEANSGWVAKGAAASIALVILAVGFLLLGGRIPLRRFRESRLQGAP